MSKRAQTLAHTHTQQSGEQQIEQDNMRATTSKIKRKNYSKKVDSAEAQPIQNKQQEEQTHTQTQRETIILNEMEGAQKEKPVQMLFIYYK